jgi:hypothetical protein
VAWRGHDGIARDEVVALLAAHPYEVDSMLAYAQGVTEELTMYYRAQAKGDEAGMEWWRHRLQEDYDYRVDQPSSIINAQTLGWWQARMRDAAGADVDPKDAA